MSNHNRNVTDKAISILRILYPGADEYELERNLYFPLKRCLSIQSDLCAGFPDCMCGDEVIKATFGGQPPPRSGGGHAGPSSSGGSGLF